MFKVLSFIDSSIFPSIHSSLCHVPEVVLPPLESKGKRPSEPNLMARCDVGTLGKARTQWDLLVVFQLTMWEN